MNPTINRDFCEAYPLRVSEGRNRGALRHHDDDNLQRGFFDDQDEFCPPFRDGDDFRLSQRRNIQQRQQQRLDYSSREEDDFCFNYQANNQGQNNQEFKMKMDLPSFDGRLHIEDFLDWVYTVGNFFNYLSI